MSHIRVNIKHRVQNAAIRSEVRNGRDVMIIPSAVAKFNTTLNNIHYPEDELRKSYLGINDTTAPLGHPVINNQHVSARTPGAINQFHIGAHNENARIEGDRIIADMVLDVDYAKRHPDGQRFLDAINAGKPISTSTGLMMEREDAPEGTEYKYIGRNYAWDHVAALLDEAPAIGTESGIGLMVNAAGEQEQVEVVNSELVLNEDADAEQAMRFAFEVLERDEQRGKYNGMVSKVMTYMKELLSGGGQVPAVNSTKAHGLNVNHDTPKEVDMTPEELKAALAEQATNMQTAINSAVSEAVGPLQQQITAMNAEREAATKAERDTLAAQLVGNKALTQEEADAMDVNALKVADRLSKGAAPLAPGLHANRSNDITYEAPEA